MMLQSLLRIPSSSRTRVLRQMEKSPIATQTITAIIFVVLAIISTNGIGYRIQSSLSVLHRG